MPKINSRRLRTARATSVATVLCATGFWLTSAAGWASIPLSLGMLVGMAVVGWSGGTRWAVGLALAVAVAVAVAVLVVEGWDSSLPHCGGLNELSDLPCGHAIGDRIRGGFAAGVLTLIVSGVAASARLLKVRIRRVGSAKRLGS